MRDLPVLLSKWQSGGPYTGDMKPTTRVTVQAPWPDLVGTEHPKYFLRRTWNSGIGSSSVRGIPMRWWQRRNNTQVETEIPNISAVSVNRSVDQDAANFQISLSNQWMYVNGAAPTQSVMGQPGYFTPTRGDSADEVRWGHTQNEWNDVLVPNALIRIYTGYGGDGDIETEVANGNLCLYFVGLVDEVQITTDGKLAISGRDMMKLLIDQQLFPPLIPADKYPLAYQRWYRENVAVNMAAKQVVVGATAAPATLGAKRTVYEDSATDRWYGNNASIYGHRATDSLDGNQSTYALSVGSSGANRPFSTNWWQYSCNEEMNAVHVHPWAGNYFMYVSVMEGGSWVAHPDPPPEDDGVVPYDASHLFDTQTPAVDTGAAIPYVAKFFVPWETARDYVLPRTYNAQSVRVSFRNLAHSGLGVWKYRAGIREFRCVGIESSSGGGQLVGGTSYLLPPFCQAAAPRHVPGKSYSQGYLTVSNFDQTDAFGDARILPVTGGAITPNVTVTSVCYTRSGEGYYVMTSDGALRAHGDAVLMGNPTLASGVHAWDMAMTHTGEGYWILSTNGVAHAYGDAVGHNITVPVEMSNNIVAVSITSHPSAYGVWVMRTDGQIYSYGACTYHGGAPLSGPNALQFRRQSGLAAFETDSESGTCVHTTRTGDGYWILTSKGRVYAFGDAVDYGQPHTLVDHSKNLFTESYWALLPAPDDKGYILLHGSGQISAHGEIEPFGGPVPGTHAELRSDGNYLDYVDVVKDLLLWSGFLLFDASWPLDEPAPLYAGLESTGAWASKADGRLPDEIFDKKPVIDAITTLKEVVGYITYIDQYGRFVFRSPNWWHIGNFSEDGHHEEILLDIDEKHQMTAYTLSFADDPMRSSITISSHDPYADLSGTVTSTYEPPGKDKLRGLVKPAMWVNDYFMDEVEQDIMAELIGLHIAFQERVGQVSCLAYPGLEVDDQVRLYERQTGETYVHYVRGISFNHNLDSGDYQMTLTTHWLAAGSDSGTIVDSERLPVSSVLAERIAEQRFGKFERDPGEYTT